jgi:hypothetical protein
MELDTGTFNPDEFSWRGLMMTQRQPPIFAIW